MFERLSIYHGLAILLGASLIFSFGFNGDEDDGAEQEHAQAESDDADSSQEETTRQQMPCGTTVESDVQALFPMPDDDQWGYVDADGDWQIEPQWWRVNDFHEGRAVVKESRVRVSDNRPNDSGSWSVINTDGDVVLESGISSEGVHRSDEPWGDRGIADYSDSCAVIEGASDYHWIDRDGQKWQAQQLSEDLADVEIGDVGPFSNGRVLVQHLQSTDDNFPDRKYGWLSRDGEFVIEPQFQDGGAFAEGKAPVALDRREWTFVNEDGDIEFSDMALHRTSAFSQGWAAVRSTSMDDDFSFGHIDHDGHLMDLDSLGTDGESRPGLAGVGDFNNGLAPIYVREDTGQVEGLVYIDTDGALAFDASEKAGAEICNARHNPEFHHGRVRLLVARDSDDGCGDENFRAEFPTYETARYIYLDSEGEKVLEEP